MTTFCHHSGLQRPYLAVPHTQTMGGVHSGLGSPYSNVHMTSGATGPTTAGPVHYYTSPHQSAQACRICAYVFSIFLIFSGISMSMFGFLAGVTAVGVIGIATVTFGVIVITVSCVCFQTHSIKTGIFGARRSQAETEISFQPPRGTIQGASAPPLHVEPSDVTVGHIGLDCLAGPTHFPEPGSDAFTGSADFSCVDMGTTDHSVLPPCYDESAHDFD